MKKLTLLSALVVLLFGNIQAETITTATAKTVATNFFRHNSGLSNVNLTLEHTEYTADNTPVYFVFNNGHNEGFIIVTATDDALPILGYANKGHFTLATANSTTAKWLFGYKKDLITIKNNQVRATPSIRKNWEDLANNVFPSAASRGTNAVSPLVPVQWDQSPFVNDYCPWDSAENKNCVTGCPATAMAQIMRYWKHPYQGSGSHSYNHPKYGTISENFSTSYYEWDSMPAIISAPNEYVAQLMADCGTAIDMEYSANSSGSYVIESKSWPQTACSEYAYKTFFGYDKTTTRGLERENYSDSAWIAILKNELDLGRPMQYAGFGGGGHTFVCDGYDANNMFHMNWGWGGVLDGFFTLNSLNPGGGGIGAGEGNYNSGQQAVVGLKPAQALLSSAPIFGLKLASTPILSANPLEAGMPLSVDVSLTYTGASPLTTDLAALLFSETDEFMNEIEVKTGQVFTNGVTVPLTFSTPALNAIQIKQVVGIYSSLPGDSVWRLVNKLTYTNPVNISISGPANDLKLAAAMAKTPNVAIANTPFSITASVQNTGATNYNGSLVADIFDANGQMQFTLKQLYNVQINAGATASNLVFNTSNLGLAPGSYYVAIFDSVAGSYPLVSNLSFPNPASFQVIEAPLSPDAFEVNNTQATAFSLPVTFTANEALVKTTGSNVHTGGDIDYYKLVLPAGYNYAVTGRLHDEYSATNGLFYSCDMNVSYSTGAAYSDSYDDTIPATINLFNGGTLTFKVTPFYAGLTGTYLLDLVVKRTANVGIDEVATAKNLFVYPNPTADELNIEVKNAAMEISNIEVKDNVGKTVKTFTHPTSNTTKIDVSDLSNGIYILQLNGKGKESIAKQFVKTK